MSTLGQPGPIEQARHLVGADLPEFERILAEMLDAQAPHLSQVERDIYARGKRLRPLLTLLSARLTTQVPEATPVNDKVIRAAVAVEMLHVATLIHDDIVDSAPFRRGLPSVSAARGTHTAVLIGDLQYVQAIRCFADQVKTDREMQLVRNILDVAFRLCIGELDELATTRDGPGPSAIHGYFRTIERKTSALFGLSCEVGCILNGGGNRKAYCVSQFGRFFGNAFQIMDDILDLVQSSEVAGKRRGSDLMQRRYSLPILYAQKDLPPNHLVNRLMQGKVTPEDSLIEEAIETILESPAVWHAYDDARANAMEAEMVLEAFEPSKARDALIALARFIVDRPF